MYRLTTEQKESLVGVSYDGEQYFNPIQDVNGDWFISFEEVSGCNCDGYSWVCDLVASEFEAPVTKPI